MESGVVEIILAVVLSGSHVRRIKEVFPIEHEMAKMGTHKGGISKVNIIGRGVY